jgi:hypothetical protein
MKKLDIQNATDTPKPENLIWSRFLCLRAMDEGCLSNLVELTIQINPQLQNPFQVFIEAMRGINKIACLPFNLTIREKVEALRNRKFNTLIRKYENLVPQHDFETRDGWVSKIKERVLSEINETNKQVFEKEIEVILSETADALLSIAEPEIIDTASRELRYQTAVSLWSCLETLIKDHIIDLINLKPCIMEKICDQKSLKTDLGLKKIDLAVLIENNFDLRDKMGAIIFSNSNAAKIGNLKRILYLIYPTSKLSSVLSDVYLYELNLQRNLIVHHRGVCDLEYIKRSSSQLEIGQKIDVTPGLIIKLYEEISRFATSLADEAIKLNDAPSN